MYYNWMSYQKAIVAILFVFLSTKVYANQPAESKSSLVDTVRQAAAEGKLAYRLTTPEEVKVLLGQPTRQEVRNERDELLLEYPQQVEFKFRRESETEPFTLQLLEMEYGKVDIGGILQGDRQVIVQKIQDLKRLAALRNVDLSNLDLTEEGDYLNDREFDSLTKWPGPEKLPAGFDPQKLLEEGKNPGLGVRKLHEQGIDGRGIGIAILDQKLLQNHVEYADRIVRYEEIKLPHDQRLQMHGPPIVSIAVGKNCGVAPKAFVFYYAAMTTLEHKIHADCINEIIKYNETNPETGRIRVVSISASPEGYSDNEAYLRARKNALDAGIFIATCASEFLNFGVLTLIEGQDPDNPENYRVGPGGKVNIPTGNKTIATHQGTNVYKYERAGGFSWAAPYIAGLAALAFQVNPDLQPQAIAEQLAKTATHTKAGPVVNPRGFIESVKRLK
jgi:hypothetical protein